MARNEQIRNLQNEMRTMYGGAGDAMNRAFYDATRTEAARRANTGDPNHISNQIFNAIANNGSQMMVPGATFQLPSGDQALNYIDELQRQGGQVGDSVRQMAADSDWLNRQTRTGLYASGSLNNWQANPLAYRSMNGPAKQIIDIDSEDSLAFGGDGSQMARQLGQGIIRDNQWARDAQSRQMPKPPVSMPVDGKSTTKFFGDPTKDYSQGQQQLAQKPPLRGGVAVDDGADPNGWLPDGVGEWKPDPVHVPTKAETMYENDQARRDWNMFYGGKYSPSIGNTDGFQAEARKTARNWGTFNALPAAMGAAQAPMIYSRPAPAQPKPQPAQAPNPMKSPVRPFNASDFSMNTLEPSRAFGGTLSPGWLDVDMSHGPLFVNTYRQAPRTMGDNAFNRYETNPFSAGRIQAFMR